MTLKFDSTSTPLVKVPIKPGVTNGVPINPTIDVVGFAFMLGGAKPTASDWHPGLWETEGAVYLACCLVGPVNGGVALPPGTYAMKVRVIDSPEAPVFDVGYLVIT